jgi:hypothetical protein
VKRYLNCKSYFHACKMRMVIISPLQDKSVLFIALRENGHYGESGGASVRVLGETYCRI